MCSTILDILFFMNRKKKKYKARKEPKIMQRGFSLFFEKETNKKNSSVIDTERVAIFFFVTFKIFFCQFFFVVSTITC